jgi:tRNA dimethylallyltransferase
VVVIVGPTAVGKTALGIRLCEALRGEIVSADSRQVYRRMDIGTAKATPRERGRVPHHLLDVVNPDEVLTLAQFQQLAYAAIDDIHSRGRVPFVVGGSGQYVMSIVEGWRIPRVAPDEELRSLLYREAEEKGDFSLHDRLRTLDPVAAERIDRRNVRRVVRALEVCLTTGRPISAQQGKSPPPYRFLVLGLTMPRPELFQRIDSRIDRMLEDGLEAEMRGLVSAGFGFDLPAMSGVGYGQFEAYLAGGDSLANVTGEIGRATRRLVRQQSNWFRTDDQRIHWLDALAAPYDDAARLVTGFLAQDHRCATHI